MTEEMSPIARALGRIPTGLYIVTTRGEDGPLGFVGSFLVQVGFVPPAVCVAVGRGRAHLDAMRASRRFAVSILDADSSAAMGVFFQKLGEGETPFDRLETRATPGGCFVLANALAWLDCHATGEHETADHVVVFGEVTAASLEREGDPSVHLRKNGLQY